MAYPRSLLRARSCFSRACAVAGVLVLSAGGLPPLRALTAARIFGDHMVLQRQQPVKIWGTQAPPGVEVRAEVVRADGSVVRAAAARADTAGKWMLVLAAFDRSENAPLELRLSAGDETRRFTDILVGDVWFCAGQSNMNLTLAHNAHRDPLRPFKHEGEKGGYRLPDYDARIDGAIRHFGVEKISRLEPQEELAVEFDADVWRENSWQLADGAGIGGFTAVGFYFARACRQARLAAGEDVPIGIVRCSWGGTPIETWMSAGALAARPEFARQAEMRRNFAARARMKALAEGQGESVAGRYDGHRPASAFNAMVYPLRHLAVRGFLWYQGESNTRDHAVYGEEMRALIRDWRALWCGEARAFAWVQLPGLPRLADQGEGQLWPWLREAQGVALVEPRTTMTISLDLGSTQATPGNTDMEIHPRTKEALGRRLALTVLGNFYGQELLADSPRFRAAKRTGSGLRLRFDTHGAGLGTLDGAAVTGFEISGADGKWWPAGATLDEGDAVLVFSPEVPQPLAARYAWNNAGRGNLSTAREAVLPQPGAAGLPLGRLPVGTFRTTLSP